MKLSAYRVLGVATAAVCVVAVCLAWFLGGCTGAVETAAGGTVPMKCHWTIIAVFLIEVMAAFSTLGLAFVKCKIGRRWLACSGVLAQALVLIALYSPLMGLCGDATMHCHLSANVLAVAAAVAIVLCVVAAALADPKRADMPKRGL